MPPPAGAGVLLLAGAAEDPWLLLLSKPAAPEFDAPEAADQRPPIICISFATISVV